MLPTAAEVLSAAHRLRSVIERTPLVRSSALSTSVGADVYLKCEQLQRTGSFKLRGAYNALATMSEDARARGVVASSAGNHGLGVAHAARLLGVRARIFVPSSAPAVKQDGIRALGAEVDASAPHYDVAQEAAMAYAEAHAMTFVSPCAGAMLLAGQGTVALEILEDLPNVGSIVVSIGGGGLVGGIAALVRAVAPKVRIIGAQTERTNAMAASLQNGRVVPIDVEAPTIADGLAGAIDEVGLAIGQFAIDDMCVVTEAATRDAMAWLAREHDMRVEGAAAASVAALLSHRLDAAPGPIAAILCGGNIDPAKWSAITGSK